MNRKSKVSLKKLPTHHMSSLEKQSYMIEIGPTRQENIKTKDKHFNSNHDMKGSHNSNI